MPCICLRFLIWDTFELFIPCKLLAILEINKISHNRDRLLNISITPFFSYSSDETENGN